MTTTLKIKTGTQAEILDGLLSSGEYGYAYDTETIYYFDGNEISVVSHAVEVTVVDHTASISASGGVFFTTDTGTVLVLSTPIGPQGLQGYQGVIGATGPQGNQGYQGVTGA